MAPGPRTCKGVRKTTQTPTTFRLKKFVSPSAHIRRSSRLYVRRSFSTLTANEPETISDSTPAPSLARPASPTQTPSPATSFSTTATPVPTRTPPPSPPPSHTEANLLTHVFRHFGVSLTNEVLATKPVPIITSAAFVSIQFLKTDHSGWEFVKDMTIDELLTVSQSSSPPIPPRIPSAQSPPSSSLLDQIQHLDERLYEL
ncbi:hypothetical protein Cgig2_017920 [Carnegiea gigantea]|uniref:Uncharacterized protein n=1 Tax=Carnegiea gigantea TaxID=171969 RepID=A0A9Q1K756_9CARY|nr:hypothetical protein Cgig2_017920 [Carnegiea gigantea]